MWGRTILPAPLASRATLPRRPSDLLFSQIKGKNCAFKRETGARNAKIFGKKPQKTVQTNKKFVSHTKNL